MLQIVKWNQHRFVIATLVAVTVLHIVVFIYHYHRPFFASSTQTPQRYSVFGCSTPKQNSHRGYDYAFYLPLTALAWKRIGFSNIVLISGTQNEWDRHPALSWVLSKLVELEAKVLFLDTRPDNLQLMSQVGRIFFANMAELMLRPNDFVITTDADLWPLRKSHFEPQENCSLVLVHSGCCGEFKLANMTYTMLPMSNIGTTHDVWQDIINFNQTIAFDSETILQYLEKHFPREKVRNSVQFASDEWYMDQKLVSVKIAEWIGRNPKQLVCKVSDEGFSRLDRIQFNPHQISKEEFINFYDSHLPLDGYQATIWLQIKFLINLMYGEHSAEAAWCDNYTQRFHEKLQLFSNP